MPKVSVVVPTYCEAANLPTLVHRLADALHDAALDAEIIIVDDNSPDDTPGVCRELAERLPVRLLVRTEERGLSSAVIAGMKIARGDVLVCMDADLSHPPECVPELVAALEIPSVDFVVGSRYVKGGSTDENWGLFRQLNSQVATLLARPLTTVRDPMAGFFALRRETFAAANNLNPIGYKIGLELIVKCRCENVCELPISFANRLHGESKLSLNEQIKYLQHLHRLYDHRFGTWWRLLQFLVIGSSGAVVDLGALSVLLRHLPFSAARAMAIWGAMTWNFALNRQLTFASAKSGSLTKQYVGFCLGCLVGAVASWGLSVALVDGLRVAPFVAAAAGIVAGAASNFVLCQWVVFGRKSPDKATAPASCVDANRNVNVDVNQETHKALAGTGMNI